MSATAEKIDNKLGQWPAYLQLQFSAGSRGTVLNRCRHQGPLYVQKSFYPEGKDCAHTYLLHPPGGMVSGDELSISIDVKENAHALLTTPGAARAYRARPKAASDIPVQKQNVDIQLAKNAIVEWFPMETIIYNGAAAELGTRIDLTDNSIFMGWEVTCIGLPASQALMTSGYFTQHYTISRHGLPVFMDRLHFDATQQAMFTGQAGMRSCTSSGFFIAGGVTENENDIEKNLEKMRSTLEDKRLQKYFAISHLTDFYVVRYLGDSANQARDGFALLWEILRPQLIQRKACAPRIWLT